jgi:hypothetical protein
MAFFEGSRFQSNRPHTYDDPPGQGVQGRSLNKEREECASSSLIVYASSIICAKLRPEKGTSDGRDTRRCQ